MLKWLSCFCGVFIRTSAQDFYFEEMLLSPEPSIKRFFHKKIFHSSKNSRGFVNTTFISCL